MKLTGDIVLWLRKQRLNGASYAQLMEAVPGISHTGMVRAINGSTWTWVEMPGRAGERIDRDEVLELPEKLRQVDVPRGTEPGHAERLRNDKWAREIKKRIELRDAIAKELATPLNHKLPAKELRAIRERADTGLKQQRWFSLSGRWGGARPSEI